MTWPKCVVIIVVLLGLYGANFLYFLLPGAFSWLSLAGLVFWVPLFIFSLESLFKRRWKLVSIFAVVWVLLSPVFLNVWAPRYWLRGQGFHLSSLLNKEYFSGCKLTEFVENGIKQAVGFCGGGDRGDYFDYVVYDTTSESALPVSQRASEWKRLMAKATEEGGEAREEPTYHLFGNFYATSVSIYGLGPEHSRD